MLKYGLTIVSIIFSFYVLYSCSARYIKIKELPENIIKNKDRDKYLTVLKKYILTTVSCFLVCLLSIFVNMLELKICIAIASIFISSSVFMNLLDEIADFDISKKDSDIITEFLNKRLKDSKEKESLNKVKKIDLEDLDVKKDIENESKTENLSEESKEDFFSEEDLEKIDD